MYGTTASPTDGRDGTARNCDGRFGTKLSKARELGGSGVTAPRLAEREAPAQDSWNACVKAIKVPFA